MCPKWSACRHSSGSHRDGSVLWEVAVIVQPDDFIGAYPEEALLEIEIGFRLRLRRMGTGQPGDHCRLHAGHRSCRRVDSAYIKVVAKGEVVGMKEAFGTVRQSANAE